MNLFLSRRVRRVLVLSAVILLGIGAASLHADGLKSAQVSRLYNDVKLLPENQPARAAAVTDVVSGKAAVQTGTSSRAELVFTDKTLTRLGANTFFSFENGTRNLDLGKGTMLLQVPKDAGGAEIHTAAVTAAITGTTLMVEYNPKSYSKIIVLEGTVRAYLKGHIGESVLIHAGEMLITPPEAKRLPDSSVHVDLSVLYATSGLLDERLFGPLPSDRLVSNEINRQKGDVAKGRLHGSNLFIAGLGTQVQVGNLAYVGATNTRITAQQGQNSAINLDHPGSGTPKPTIPPVSATLPPVSPTVPPVSPTVPPVSPTVPPVSPTVPPVSPTVPPVSPTIPPVSPTVPPVSPTIPPVSPTVPPVSPTVPPVSPTVPPVSPTVPPVSPTVPPVSPTVPPVSPTVPPVSPTVPPVSPTVPPVSPTVPPVSPTVPPVSPTVPPVSPTVPPVSPTPTPSKTGPLVTIPGNDAGAPSAYNIDNTTAILTDPYITTQGVTSYGKIYRGSAAGDGAPSSFLLGAATPSAFDTQVGFDTQFDTGTQIGAFLFNSLAFTGAPASISTAGGPSSLALIAVNGITAAPSSAITIDVTGLTQVLLATQNGPITLSNVTFTDNASGTSLTLYARGAANALNVTANLGVSGNVSLFGEGGVSFNPGAQALNASSATLISGADLTLGGVIIASGSASSAINAMAAGDLTITTSGALNSAGALSLTSSGTFQSDGVTSAASALNITSGGDLNTTANALLRGNTVTLAGADLSLGGAITAEGASASAISATAGGNLTVASSGALNSTGALTLTSGGNLAIMSGGALNATGTLTLTSGGTFQSSGVINAGSSALNITSAGELSTANAQLTGGTVTLANASGALVLGGTTLFSNSLAVSSAGSLNIPGVVGGVIAGSTTPQTLGTAMFSTNGGNLGVTGQITAATVDLTAASGNYTSGATAAITAETVTLSGVNLSLGGAVTAVSGQPNDFINANASGNLIVPASGNLNAAGTLTLMSGGTFQSAGTTAAGGSVNITSAGDLTTTGTAQLNGPALTLSSSATLSLNGSASFFNSVQATSVGNMSLLGAVAGATMDNPAPQTVGTAMFSTSQGNLNVSGQITADTVNLTAATGNYTSTSAATITANRATISGVALNLGGAITAEGTGANALTATASGNLTIPTGSTLNSAGALSLTDGGTFQSDGSTIATHALNIASTGDLSTTANALMSGNTVTLAGADLSLAGTITTSGSDGSAISATATGNLAIPTGGTLTAAGPLTLMSGGTFQSDGVTSAGSNALSITATSDLTTTANAQLTGGTVTLTSNSGALKLGGTTLFSNSLTALSAGNLNIPGIVGGITAGSTMPQTLGTAMFATIVGDLGVSGQITADTVNLNAAGGNYSSTSAATITADTITISGFNLTLGGAITANNGPAETVSATANGDLTIPTGGALYATGSLTLTSGGTFQSDGITRSAPGTVSITSLGDLTTTSNAIIYGKTLSLNATMGGLTLGGTTSFDTSLSASAASAMNINGAVGGDYGSGAAFGTATFATSTGNLSVGGQITAGTVNLTTTNGNYSTGPAAVITANAVNISAPSGSVSLSAGAYVPGTGGNEVLNVTGNTITIPDPNFTPQANQFYELTQQGPFTVPAGSAYSFDSLTLNNESNGTAGDLNLDAGSTLSLNTATVGGGLNLADGATFTNAGDATIGQAVTLTGAPTLNINGTLAVNNAAGAAAAFTATGAATINLGSPGATGLTPTLYVPNGNFNGGAATINGFAGSRVELDNGSFTTTGSVTADSVIVGGNVLIGGALQAGYVNAAPLDDDTITVGALSAGILTTPGSVFVTGDVTPYNLTSGDTLSAALLGVTGSLNYAGTTNAGQLTLTLQSGFNLGAGAASVGAGDSYAVSMNFAGAALAPTADNLTAGQGGSLTINTGNSAGTGDFAVGDFTGNNGATTLNLQGGDLTSAGNTGFGGNGGTLLVNSANNVNLNSGVTVNAYGGDFTNSAPVTGTGTPTGGNGGTVTLNALVNTNGAVNVEDSTVIDLHGGAVGAGGASGGIAGNGGTLTLNAGGQIALGNGTGTPPLFNAQGGVNSQAGTSGNGGSISLLAGGSIMLEPAAQLTADGGLLSGASGTAGHGGTVTLQAAGVITLGFYTDITPDAIRRPIRVPEGSPGESGLVFLTADGGTANQAGLASGNGGTVNIASANTDTTQSSIQASNVLISATTGGNSMTAFGGIGGTINITASNATAASPEGSPPPAQIDLDNTTVVASDDGTVASNTPSSHSQVGGTINITSMLPSGPGILVADGSNLVALVNASSPGAGGTIKLLTSGATIEVDSSTLQASGTGSLVQLSTQQAPDSGSTSINLSGATLSADTVNLSTAGSSDQINISGGSTLTAGSTLTINGTQITLGDGDSTNQLTANATSGTINLFATNGTDGSISLNAATLSANTVNIQTAGESSSTIIADSNITGNASLSISGAIIQVTDTSTLTSNSTTGSITLDTTLTGNITLSSSSLSAASLTLAAPGAGAFVNVMANSTLNGANSLALQGANIEVNNSTLTSSGNSSVFSLGGADGTGSGANILVSSGILEADGQGSKLTLTGAPGTGADITVNGVSDLEANGAGNVLTLTTASTTGTGIMISSGSTLSSTYTTNGTVDGGTINLTTAGAAINVDDSTLTASGTASAINLASTGAGANITVTGGSSLTLGSTGFPGAISLTSTGSAANVTVDDSTLLTAGMGGGTISLLSIGMGSTLNVTGGSTVNGDASVSLAGTTITVTSSTVSADSSVGTVTLDTTDATQDGVVNITSSTLSAGMVSLTARGTNGAITVAGTGGTGGVQAMLAAGSGNLTLQTPGANGSITISPDSTLAANSGTLNLLAAGATGLITVGTANTSNTDATTLSADLLKMRAMGTNGSIVINANSTLSATNQLLLYADGSNGSITFQGGNITLNTGSLAGILAAPSITIKTNTTVTVNGSVPIQVFTNNANYSDDYGGNDTQVGGFAGTAQPSGTPQPFSAAPAYPSNGNALKVVSNSTAASAAGSPTPAPNAAKIGKSKLTGTAARPIVMPMQRPSIPFSALNPNDLSYDPRLLQGGPKTAAAAAKPGKAGGRAPGRDESAGREKVRDAAARPGIGLNHPPAPVLPAMVHLPH